MCTSGDDWHHIKVYSDPHSKDTDNDGVDDDVEFEDDTNPQDEDTDNDGLTDYEEIYTYHTYAYTWDSDEDRLSDKQEIEIGTNPKSKDTDGDGMDDFWEYSYSLNPLDASDSTEDSDNDGLKNIWEYQLNRNPKDSRNVFKISLTVSLEWNAGQEYIDKLKNAFKGASLYMMTVTDGYVYISDVTIYNNKRHWDDVNIRIGNQDAEHWASDKWWPRAFVNGYWNGINWWPGYVDGNWRSGEVILPRTFQGYDPDTGYYYTMIVHELGHYVFGFYDEYGYYHGDDFEQYSYTDWYSLMTDDVFYMSYHQWYENWFNAHGYLTPTAQWQKREMSCWEWFVYQMGEDKAHIEFNAEALLDDYIPYGAYTEINSYSPGDQPPIKINYDFSVETWKYRSLNFEEIYARASPNMDISESMSIRVI